MSVTKYLCCDAQRVEILNSLRDARAVVLRDSESFHEASMVLERIGQILGRRVGNGLNDHEKEIVALACESPHSNPQDVRKLFHVVREARNMAVHEGAYARHLTSRLVELFLLLEEAVMLGMKRVEELMVRIPIVAEPWHLIAQVRRTMLGNSFSTLPTFVKSSDRGDWKLITDLTIMQRIRAVTNDVQKMKTVLALPVNQAI